MNPGKALTKLTEGHSSATTASEAENLTLEQSMMRNSNGGVLI